MSRSTSHLLSNNVYHHDTWRARSAAGFPYSSDSDTTSEGPLRLPSVRELALKFDPKKYTPINFRRSNTQVSQK